jgi:hypothetical protein
VEDIVKTCKQCGQTKAWPVWLRGLICHDCTKINKKAYYAAKPEKYKALSRAYAKANPEKLKAYQDRTKGHRRKKNLMKKYGITEEQFNQMFEEQGRCCAICKSSTANAGRYGWHTDHCHETNKVRGILCHGCNIGIGNLRHNPTTLRAAAEYLEYRQ